MEQFYYIYDGNERDWIESDEVWVKEDIEKIPVEFINSAMTDEEISSKASRLPCRTLLSYVDVDYVKESYNCTLVNSVARWRVILHKEEKVAIITADTFNAYMKADHYTRRLNHRNGVMWHSARSGNVEIDYTKRPGRQISLRLDYGKGKYTAVPSKSDKVESGNNVFQYKYDWTDDNHDFSVEIPQKVVNRAIMFLKELATEEFGFCPTVPIDMPGHLLLKYFVQYPLDPGVGYYVDMLGFDFFCNVMRQNDSNFGLVCDYLKLPKTKGLKKAYHENALSLALCFFLKDIGIEDKNIFTMEKTLWVMDLIIWE